MIGVSDNVLTQYPSLEYPACVWIRLNTPWTPWRFTCTTPCQTATRAQRRPPPHSLGAMYKIYYELAFLGCSRQSSKFRHFLGVQNLFFAKSTCCNPVTFTKTTENTKTTKTFDLFREPQTRGLRAGFVEITETTDMTKPRDSWEQTMGFPANGLRKEKLNL